MGEAVGEAVGEALGDADGVLVAGTVPSAGAVCVASGRVGGSGGGDSGRLVGCPIRSSGGAESNVERAMATTAAPTSTNGAKTAVRGNSVHGESPAWVRPSRR